MYQINISKKALKFIEKQPKPKRELLLNTIANLPSGDTKPLKGHDGLYRLRVGSYRVIYTVDNGNFVIYVINADNRGQIYKNHL